MSLPPLLGSVPLRFRLAAYAFLAGVLIVAVVVQQTTQAGRQRLEEHHEASENTMLDLMSEISVGPLLTAEYSVHSDLLRGLRSDADIAAIDLLDMSGTVVASSDEDRIGVVDPAAEVLLPTEAHGDVGTRLVTGPSGVLGTIRMTFDGEADQQLLADQRRQGLIAGLLGVVLVAVLSMLAGRLFTERLARLNAQLGESEVDGIPELIEVDGDDEIAKVGAALNQRTTRIKDAIEIISRNREALRYNEARLQLALSAAVDTVVEVDLSKQEFLVMMPGPVGAELATLAPSAGSLANLVHPADRAALEGAVIESIANQSETVKVEVRAQGRDQRWRTLLVRMRAVESDEGPPTRVLLAILDVTDQRTSERRMVHADKMRSIGQLTSGITHDFNNALAISTLTVGLLQDPDRDRSMDDKHIARLAASNDLAGSMVKRLLLAAGPQSVAPTVIDVNHMVEEVGKLLRRLLGDGIEIEIDTFARNPTVLIDEGSALQVLLNLAQNGADAMEGNGRLTVQTSNGGVDGSSVVITVSDTGPGIDPAIRASLFEPFVTTKSIGAGTGLGLATTLETITASNGTIEVSDNVGSGATFAVTLPFACRGESAVSVEGAAASRPDRTDRLILIVEDHTLVLESVATTLELEGFETLRASTPSEALAQVEGLDRLDMLLTDVQLPEMSGIELATRMRVERPELRVLYMSGYVPGSDSAALESSDVLSKPFSNEQLLAMVASSLSVAMPVV